MSVVSMKSQHGVSFLKKTGRKGNNPPSVAVGNPSSQAAYKELSSPDLKSVWQTKDVASFFENAEAECKDFTSTRDARLVHMPLKYRSLPIHTDVLCNTLRKPQFCSMADRSPFELAAELLTIPRRPSWHYEMKKEEVDGRERECFNAWKRSLTVVEDTHQQVVSPYERNLEVWRQLWRVVERCDFVFQIVDARNPLRFRSVDLERFISEHTSPLDALPKQCVLLLNKADLLTLHQRDAWAKYLKAMGIPFVFFSALRSWEESLKQSAHEEKQKGADNSSQHLKTSHQKHLEKRKQRRLRGAPHEHVLLGQGKDFPEWVYERANALGINPREVYKQSVAHSGGGEAALQKNEESMSTSFSWTSDEQARSERVVKSLCANFSREANFSVLSSPAVFDATMLLDLMVGIHRTYLVHETGSDKLPTSEIRQSSDDSGAIGADGSNPPIRPICVGFVGYPNVGKSCTINALIGAKKVTVSSTPGKTKHLQTLHIPGERRVVLCDCPGLVFPTFCLTTEDMVCDGILPIAHMKDFVLPTQLVCNRIPRSVLEAAYNISLDPSEDVDACTSLPDFLLSAIARRRGFMGDHNQPNRSRAARLLLHDFVSGKLIFVHPPPHRTSEPAQTTSDFEHKSSTSSDAGQEWENVSNTDNEEDRERSANIDHPTNCEMAQTPQQLDTSNTTADGSNGMSSIRFYAPLFLLEAESPEVNRSAQTRRSYEEMFNRNVNASIIRSRNADIERRRNYTRKGKNNHHETDETEESLWELIENGEYALAVEAEDGIVRYEDEVPMIPTTGSGSKTEDGNRNKRQQRRQEKQQLMKKNAHVQHIAQY